ncbi:MAG TPA: hypothetical protein VFB58_07950 [Chloroflexota bacterium]|nr:hypothetical protein [Chloroflexota bacterium]
MSHLFDPTFLSLAAGIAVSALLIGCVVLLSYHVCAAGAASSEPMHKRRRCRYCHWGHADLVEENMQMVGDDIVAVRLYGCRRCGLPQWVVDRTPVMKHARR